MAKLIASMKINVLYNEDTPIIIRRFPTEFEINILSKSPFALIDEERKIADNEIIAAIESGLEEVGALYEAVKIRAALNETMRLATEVNKYLDQAAPWKQIKIDKDSAGRTIYTALRVIDSLKVMFSPILPFTCERLHTFLGYDQPLFGTQQVEERRDKLGTHTVLRYLPQNSSGRWEPSRLEPGRKLQKPEPLFTKLDEKIVEEERERLGN